MTGEPVARVGDVVASTAPAGTGTYTSPTTPPATGTWTPGSVSSTPAAKIRAGVPEVLTGASCEFSFTGKSNADPNTIVTGTSKVTLVPGSRALRVGGAAPLVNGNTKSDDFDNTLTVVSDASWRTE